jgi:hypothetical protein
MIVVNLAEIIQERIVKVLNITGFLCLIAWCSYSPDVCSAQDSTRNDLPAGKQEQQQNQERNREQHNFMDENGDGFNDNAPDHDGDGIPNPLDPDYKAQKPDEQQDEFIDADGDGINDHLLQQGKEKKLQKKQKAGQKSAMQSQDGSGKQQRKGKGR